ncbi:hypothetical protein [Halorhabdus salina]|uniref:hypothetical protein n=1 Tax=Halorhabdus salina TaxID=2750670 RepID=UPI0015EEBFDF|nr:hypothetical protein [Halorhabdus salina]
MLNSLPRHVRAGVGITCLGFALVLAIGMIAMSASAASVATQNVTVDAPDAQSVEVSLNFSASTDATVELLEGESLHATETVSGNSSASPVTVTLDPASADAGSTLDLVVESPDAANVSIASVSLEKTLDLTIDDLQNESVVVDAEFVGDENATGEIAVENATGVTEFTETLNYTADESGTLQFVEYNESAGLTEGDYTVSVSIAPASEYQSVYVSTTAGGAGGGLLGTGFTASDDPLVLAAVGVLVLGGAGFAYTRWYDEY